MAEKEHGPAIANHGPTIGNYRAPLLDHNRDNRYPIIGVLFPQDLPAIADQSLEINGA